MRKILFILAVCVFSYSAVNAQQGGGQNGNAASSQHVISGEVTEYDEATRRGKMRCHEDGHEMAFENRNNVEVVVGDNVITVFISNKNKSKTLVVVRKN